MSPLYPHPGLATLYRVPCFAMFYRSLTQKYGLYKHIESIHKYFLLRQVGLLIAYLSLFIYKSNVSHVVVHP